MVTEQSKKGMLVEFAGFLASGALAVCTGNFKKFIGGTIIETGLEKFYNNFFSEESAKTAAEVTTAIGGATVAGLLTGNPIVAASALLSSGAEKVASKTAEKVAEEFLDANEEKEQQNPNSKVEKSKITYKGDTKTPDNSFVSRAHSQPEQRSR